MAEYANGDSGSERAYEYEEERDGVERETYEYFCRVYGFDELDTDESIIAYRSWQHEMMIREIM